MRLPGPTRWRMLRDIPAIRRSLVDYLAALVAEFGETVNLPLFDPTLIVTNPDDVRHILVVNPRNYHKAGGLRFASHLLGNGLLSSEPPLHTRQRRLMQPMFHRGSIARFAEQMTQSASALADSWAHGQEVDLAVELMDLTLVIVCRALFSADARTSARELGHAFTTAQRLVTRRQRQLGLPVSVPTPANRQYLAAIRQIDNVIATMVTERRQLAEQPPDLLGMLLDARFEDGSALSDQQLRDEISTLLLAGHETVSNHLTWTWSLLAQNADVAANLRQEWRERLGVAAATIDNVNQLEQTDAVLAESLRLYPPAWTLHRRSVGPDKLPSGIVIEEGYEFLLSQYVSHRNPRYFSEPNEFRPQRWTPEFRKSLPVGAYFPFSTGPRYCIGEGFARLEATLLLVTMGQRVDMELIRPQEIVPEPLLTLRPRGGLRMRVKRLNGSR